MSEEKFERTLIHAEEEVLRCAFDYALMKKFNVYLENEDVVYVSGANQTKQDMLDFRVQQLLTAAEDLLLHKAIDHAK